MSIARVLIIIASISVICITLFISRPVTRESSIIIAPKTRDMRAEQIRLFALNAMVKANSHVSFLKVNQVTI